MKRILMTAFVAVVAGPAVALDAAGERYARQMVNGGPISIKQAAEDMFHTGASDQGTLDVAAEVLAQNYAKAEGRTEADAMAWVCKALGKSGNGRYKVLLDQAAKSGNRALEKHCGKAAEGLPDGAASYAVGSVNLAKYREGGGSASAKSAAASSTGSGSFADIKTGMSMEEVVSLIGPATSTTSKITGKAFIPFNFKGGDSVRQYGLYKGKGRIVYSKESAYTSTFRVLEVIQDSAESGYP